MLPLAGGEVTRIKKNAGMRISVLQKTKSSHAMEVSKTYSQPGFGVEWWRRKMFVTLT
jgi:hypothetical protein